MESRINPPTEDFNRHKRSNIWIYLIIIALLLVTNIYLFLQKKSDTRNNLETTEVLRQTNSEKEILQQEYDAALARLDKLTGENTELKEKVANQNSELQQIKRRISNILSKQQITATELKEAKSLIDSLNKQISNYEAQIAQLKKENRQLSVQKDSVITQNKELKEKVDVAKILHASNIRLQPIFLRRNGRRESVTSKARKVDLLRILFDIDENKLTEDGEKEFDVRIVDPDGRLLSNTALGSGSFIDNKGKTLYYSLSKSVQLASGIPLQDIDVDWRQSSTYQKGPYIVEIYYEGHLIGQGTTTLK